jgi:DNA-binding CsgD family transcriptional regulator
MMSKKHLSAHAEIKDNSSTNQKDSPLQEKKDSNHSLADRLRQWVNTYEWNKFRVVTHRLGFHRKFAKEIHALAVEKESRGQKVLAGQLAETCEKINRLCSRIDRLTRKGCETEDELDDLEISQNHAKTAIMDMAHIVEAALVNHVHQTSSAMPRTRRPRTVSSNLSEREKRIWALVHVQGKTMAQAAMELSCSRQNISKYLKSAEEKMKAERSRCVGASSRLPHDSRGQIRMSSCEGMND